MYTWTPCLTYNRSPRPTCKRRVKLLYKGLCCAVRRAKNIVIFVLCFSVPTIERKSESKKESVFPFCFYSPLDKVKIGCN
jgi:hypothetical protein